MDCFKLMFNLKLNYKYDYCHYTDDFKNDYNTNTTNEVINIKYPNDKAAILESCVLSSLLTDSIDISLLPVLITPENIKDLDFPGLSSVVKTKFIFERPKLTVITNVYTLPFTRGVWLAALGLIGLIILFLYVLTKWQGHKYDSHDQLFKNVGNNDGTERNMAEIPHSILEVAFLAISAISQQGPEKEPIGMHGKTVTWFLFLAFMFLYAAYSASIFALLQATSSEIQSIEDLLKSPLHVGFHDSSFMRRIIPVSICLFPSFYGLPFCHICRI